ncbi:mitochondrial 54S ribosomal protein YmL7/YmL5 [Saccharomycopsis crataegensis]|uniref:Mitochondrial 54S ribosomal protein YmL7/YmL5 n=1 Tax=Saccharomycopsis crataegensis TaxID=43959 RepID=A0AAV5QI30_9ASCO|nr:mitochondrial 54S ribosomal protein YmL7/YmL5 [Saccharomycopsis crataegensis]
MKVNTLGLRSFSSSSIVKGKPGYSIVHPVHHTVKIDKKVLSPRFPELKYPKNDPRSPHFKPVNVAPDRLKEHYLNILKSDLMYMTYKHDEADKIEGAKKREWDGTSAYHLNRNLRRPSGFVKEQPDSHRVTNKNVPELKSIHINCFVPLAVTNPHHAISSMLQVQQITGEKPQPIYTKSDVGRWQIRRSRRAGAKIELKGKPMNDFLLTLTELVLPRIPEFQGLRNKSGDTYGNLHFGLTHKQVRLFPEISSNPDLWPRTYGLHITFNTTAERDTQARMLLSGLGLPFFGGERHS